MKRRIYSISVTDGETKETIRRVYETYGVLLEPHGAVGWRGLECYLEAYPGEALCVCLETAHPAKFPDEIEELLHIVPEFPPSMRDIDSRQGEALSLPADYPALKAYLKKRR